VCLGELRIIDSATEFGVACVQLSCGKLLPLERGKKREKPEEFPIAKKIGHQNNTCQLVANSHWPTYPWIPLATRAQWLGSEATIWTQQRPGSIAKPDREAAKLGQLLSTSANGSRTGTSTHMCGLPPPMRGTALLSAPIFNCSLAVH
jgi:hypothetical protein